MDLYEAIKNRRSIYNISNEVIVSEEKVQEIVEYSLKNTPSAFNSQSARVVLLLEKQHDNQLMGITKESFKKIVPADKFAQLKIK